MQCSAAKSSEYDGDTSLCVWSNRASAVIASSLLLQAMRAAFPNPGPGTSAKDIIKERGMLLLKNEEEQLDVVWMYIWLNSEATSKNNWMRDEQSGLDKKLCWRIFWD